MKRYSKRMKKFGKKSDFTCDWLWVRIDEMIELTESLRLAKLTAIPTRMLSNSILD